MSLHLRLGLWYGVLTGLIVLLVSVLTYAAHTRALYDHLDGTLRQVVEGLAGEYAASPSGSDIPGRPIMPVHPTMVVRLQGAGGETLAATPGAAAAPEIDARAVLATRAGPPFDPIVGLVPTFGEAGAGRGAFGLVTVPGGSRWRVYVLPVGGPAAFLLATAPLTQIDESVDEFRRLEPLLIAGGSTVALVAGWLVAGRALRPVAALTETAGAIARSRSLSRRVPLGAKRDELGRLAATFNEMLGSLEQASQAQQRFVADASHELRAPLTAIQANLELLERPNDMPLEERQEAIAEAGRETRRLVRLVADLLALARADAGVPLRHRRVELDRVLLDALGDGRHLARGQRLTVAEMDPVQVEGDPERLRQVLLILLDNALKYTAPSGAVALGLRRRDGDAEVFVRDTGMGIPAADLPHVFERFYRADPARARDPGGTGLGLAIARWIVEQHGGELALASRPGSGTTATVRLPLAGHSSLPSWRQEAGFRSPSGAPGSPARNPEAWPPGLAAPHAADETR